MHGVTLSDAVGYSCSHASRHSSLPYGICFHFRSQFYGAGGGAFGTESWDRAVVLVDATSPLRPVIGLNEAASKAGVKLGMTKPRRSNSGEIEVRHRSRTQEKIAHAALLDLGWSVSPRIEDTAADTIVLDLAGLGSLFGSEENIARRLAEGAARLGFITQIATASNLDAAILASRAFAGITVIPEGEEAAIIGKAPASALTHSRCVAASSPQARVCATGGLPRRKFWKLWNAGACTPAGARGFAGFAAFRAARARRSSPA